jgi:hypothetical protein
MNKPPEKTIEYIPNVDDEKEYIIEYELCQLRSKIKSIEDGYHHDSPVYKNIIIPSLTNLIKTLEILNEKIDDETENSNCQGIELLLAEIHTSFFD